MVLTTMDNTERIGDIIKEDESPVDIIMDDLDAYFDDIDGRLTISRMVSDSVIKGMVVAVEQEAAERIAKKELDVVGLKEMLHIYHVGDDETKTPVIYRETRGVAGIGVEQDRLIGYVESFRIGANEQLKQLEKEVNKIRVSSIRRISSGSELIGVGGNLQEMVPEKWNDVDKSFESLKDTLDGFCRRMEVMAQLSDNSFFEWQQEREFRSKIEGMVMSNCIQSLQQEFEQILWEQNTQIYNSESGNWFDNLKEISSLRQELDSISKTISVFDDGQFFSHSSLENGDEWCSNKRTDHFHCRIPTNQLSPSTLEGNGNHEDSKNNKHENLNPVSLKHLSREELVTHYNSEITKMRRNHESQVQEVTEEIFRLRRELLKERGSSLPLRKDKEFDVLRRKIPDFISKLDNILLGNEKKIESRSTLKDRLESLHSENHQLRNTLLDKKTEFKSLSSQLSDAVEKLSQQQMTEKNLLQRIQKLECDIGDSHAEFLVIQDVYKCIFEEITGEYRCIAEESHLKHMFMEEMYEIIFREAGHQVQPSSKSEIEDSDMESIIKLGLLDVIFKEALMDAEEELRSLNAQCLNENHIRLNLEMELLKDREALLLEAAEKEKLKQEMLLLTLKLEEKDKVAEEVTNALVEEKRKMDLASEELNSLKVKTAQQQNIILENNKELDVTKGNLVEALQEVEQHKEEMRKLHQNLEQRTKELREIDEERKVLHAVTQEKHGVLMLIEAREMKTRKQMESTIVLVHELLTAVSDFESRVNKDISRNYLRLESMRSVFHCLNNKANTLKATGLLYKKRLETRCSDLEKAEAEVDLLADEVDTYLSLLEAIYKKLDHYSPILRHYPGITEILALVKRELIGEYRKPV
ncbi:hypothetical protein L6164_036983 [Bauhinia variegata]|uniref:Uncharacterized protein n=1 Tax=Bauhinia variegata TaxID=167791 RepID=A0ACB9KIR2_BAUVA|nr:hypothetical protein L6164_036983 [Bauhinia variegata]